MPDLRFIPAILTFLISTTSNGFAQTATFISSEQLPEIQIDGKSVKIHTQGLYVAEDAYIVTGRVDSPPRHPVVLKFSRRDPTKYQILDLTLLDEKQSDLNHPGGFDRDANGLFWIPISTSHRKGPTIIVGMALKAGNLPGSVAEITRRLEFPDHIGAICCVGEGRLLGANWDTKTVYLIDAASGEVLEATDQQGFFGEAAGLHLAVQDWKFDASSQLVVAAGIDKSRKRDPQTSSAVVAWIDLQQRKLTSSVRLDNRNDVARPITNEGMSQVQDQLFFLPEDFGRGAKVLRYSVRVQD